MKKLYDDRIGGGASCFVKFSGSGLLSSMSLILKEDFLAESFSCISCNISVIKNHCTMKKEKMIIGTVLARFNPIKPKQPLDKYEEGRI